MSISASHKRALSNGEAPTAKRLNQAPSMLKQSGHPPKVSPEYVFIAIEEMYGPYMETAQEVFEVYATVEDANQRLLTRQKGRHVAHFDEWETRYDKDGCFHSTAEDVEGDGHRFDVRRMEVRPPGCVPAVQEEDPPGEDDSEEEYSEGENLQGDSYYDGEEEDLYDRIGVTFLSDGGRGIYAHDRESQRAANPGPYRGRRPRSCDGCGCGSCDSCLSILDEGFD